MRSKKLNHIFSGGMYGGKNTLIRASVDRREACSPDVILSKNSFFDSLTLIINETLPFVNHPGQSRRETHENTGH